jgi:carbonic anhydrase
MRHARPLPAYLVDRYHHWNATVYGEKKDLFGKLATQGQRPQIMIVACCDSRVHVTSIFGAGPGEIFVHRNIANLVPCYEPDGLHHGTSAAVEYGVRTLKVAHLIVLGHSGCGGVEGCYDMCAGHAPELQEQTSFIGRWLDIMRPAYAALPDCDTTDRKRAMEKAAILISLDNLMTFPFVQDAVANGTLTLHAAWKDIAKGRLETYDPSTENYRPV